MSCFSMKARNFHTWHSHSCLSWLFWVRFVWTKSTLSAKAQSPLLAFQAFLGRTFRSFQESQEFPCFPGFSRLSSVQKSREKPRKPGSPGFSGVSALFLAFFGKGEQENPLMFDLIQTATGVQLFIVALIKFSQKMAGTSQSSIEMTSLDSGLIQLTHTNNTKQFQVPQTQRKRQEQIT